MFPFFKWMSTGLFSCKSSGPSTCICFSLSIKYFARELHKMSLGTIVSVFYRQTRKRSIGLGKAKIDFYVTSPTTTNPPNWPTSPKSPTTSTSSTTPTTKKKVNLLIYCELWGNFYFICCESCCFSVALMLGKRYQRSRQWRFCIISLEKRPRFWIVLHIQFHFKKSFSCENGQV